MVITGFFVDPTSKTGYSFLNKDGNYVDATPKKGQKMIANPFATGRLKRNQKQKPTARPKNGYAWQFHNGSWVQAKIAAAPKPAAKPAQKPLQTVDPRDSQYLREQGQSIYDRDTALGQLSSELSQLPSQYNEALAGEFGLNNEILRSKSAINAGLAARGAIRSGGYQNAHRRLLAQQAAGQRDIEMKYGQGRRSELTAQQQALQNAYSLQHQANIAAAQERYKQNNPASNYIFQYLK